MDVKERTVSVHSVDAPFDRMQRLIASRPKGQGQDEVPWMVEASEIGDISASRTSPPLPVAMLSGRS
jgi:hypothetical protein